MKSYIVAIAAFIMLIGGSSAALAAPTTTSSGGSGGQNPTTTSSGGAFQVTICNPLAPAGSCTGGTADIQDVIDNIIDFLIGIGIPIAAIMYIWAGFLFLTSNGDEKKITTAKRAIIWASVGLAVLIMGKGLVLVIQSVLTP